MGMNFYWEPANRKKKHVGKDDGLKWALEKKYGSSNFHLSSGDIPYLEGLRDAGREDAQELIDAIEKYEIIEITKE